MVKVLAALMVVLSVPAFAAPKAGKAAAPAPAKAAADDGELGASAKAIEFDENGNPKTADAKAEKKKEEPLKKGEITLAESCKLRTTALSSAIKRCSNGSGVEGMIPFDQMIAGCADLSGKAPYSRKDAEGCAKGIGAMKCDQGFDPMNPAALSPEKNVPACKAVLAAENGGGAAAADKNDKGFGSKNKGFDKPSTDFGKTIDLSGGDGSSE